MKEEPNNKCKELKLFHCWSDITPNIVYATMLPQYPSKQEQCLNCGLVRTYREKREMWFDYEMKELSKTVELVNHTGLTSGGGGTIEI